MTNDLRCQVIQELQKFFGLKGVTLDQRLYHDLDINGDDADAFLGIIEAKFGIKFDGFKFHTYFTDDPDILTYFVERLLKRPYAEKSLSPSDT